MKQVRHKVPSPGCPPFGSRDMIAGSPHTHRENQRMAEGLNSIITQLERQKTAIERALAALRGIEGIPAPALAPAPLASAPATRKAGMTPAGRRRLSAAMKKRWAAKKAAEVEPGATPETSTTKGKRRSAA